jgi:dTDP-4-dehydrorhamnose 3,5-epimerase
MTTTVREGRTDHVVEGGRVEFERMRMPGVIVFRPEPVRDARGFFSRTFDVDVAREAGVDPTGFVQDSLSRSSYAVIRGLHVRVGRGEGKLVRCSFGRVYDVVVDLRPGSPTFRSWEAFELDGESQTSVYIPPGCAHGFQALTETADTSYRIDRRHDPSEDLTIAWNDPELEVSWPLPPGVMSVNDRDAPPLSALTERLGQIRATVGTPR